jgi:hypothetical protein
MKAFINHFTGSKDMNIAQGANAIASQVNTIVQQVMTGDGDNVGGNKVCIASGNKSKGDQVISCQVSTSGNQSPAIKSSGNVVVTYSEDGKSKTVVSQQVQGHGNICSGTGSVVVNGVKMQGGESITVIDGDVFVNKKETKMKQSNGRGLNDIIGDIKAEVFKQHGSKGQAFLDALESLTKKPTSKGRQETLSEEVESLQLQNNSTVMALISELVLCTNQAKDQKRSEIDQLRKETESVALKIQAAHRALVDIMAVEYESTTTDFELAERAKYAIKLITGQD